VIRPKETVAFEKIVDRLLQFDLNVHALNGLRKAGAREALAEQIVESIRRVRFAYALRDSKLAEYCADASRDSFDPFRAALVHARNGNTDEAWWLIFLSVHFGRHRRDGWRLLQDFYRADGKPWTWLRASANPAEIGIWLEAAIGTFQNDGIKRRFGNHRKYETLRPSSRRGTPAVVESYCQMIGHNRGHDQFLADAAVEANGDPFELFDSLYAAMDNVTSFGRTGKFDFLTMIGKLGLAPIAPGKPYLEGATGPLAGARLLIKGDGNSRARATDVEPIVIELGNALQVGMQEMEDSLCNWQKSPHRFVAFRG
jgi:hypothetical protein